MVSISIGEYDFLSYTNTFGDLLSIFYEGDLHIEEGLETKERTAGRYFSSTVDRTKKCLDILGHSLSKAKDVFDSNKENYLENYREGYFFNKSYTEEQIKTEFTFENWNNAVKRYAIVLSKDEFSYDNCRYKELENQRCLEHTISEEIVLNSLPFDEKFMGMEVDKESKWDVFRIVLEAFEDEQEIVLDYTNLYEGGWCDEIPEKELHDIPKTVILTEGKFDTFVISTAIKLLYPFMSKFYSFIDFEKFSVQGSTNFLTHYLKAFVGAKIENKIIALYDNDAAGLCEIKMLASLQLPQNVKVLHLPNLPLCENYPTIGPTNNENTNVNGRACSIELFLGKDVLMENGTLEPVMWKGFVDKIEEYQGEVKNKSLIQKKFERKVRQCEDNSLKNLEDWKECIILLNMIFNAFNGHD